MKKIKRIIKKIPFLSSFVKALKFKNEYINDYKFFKNNYVYSKENKKKLEYQMLLIIHSIEKGMSSPEVRPFGIKKVKDLIRLIQKYENYSDNTSYSLDMALNCLESYHKFYAKLNWNNRKEYLCVDQFLNSRRNCTNKLLVGCYELKKSDFINDANIDYNSFLKSRHSVRNFSKNKLKKSDIKRAINMALKSPSACNRQMCKIYYIENEANKELIKNFAQGLGCFDLSNINYFLVTFDMSANYFIGERNQGWFNAGLISMNFVNALHSLGIGSCFIQVGNTFKEEQTLKKNLELEESERIAVIITAGYYDEVSKIPYSTRKNIDDIYFEK